MADWKSSSLSTKMKFKDNKGYAMFTYENVQERFFSIEESNSLC